MLLAGLEVLDVEGGDDRLALDHVAGVGRPTPGGDRGCGPRFGRCRHHGGGKGRRRADGGGDEAAAVELFVCRQFRHGGVPPIEVRRSETTFATCYCFAKLYTSCEHLLRRQGLPEVQRAGRRRYRRSLRSPWPVARPIVLRRTRLSPQCVGMLKRVPITSHVAVRHHRWMKCSRSDARPIQALFTARPSLLKNSRVAAFDFIRDPGGLEFRPKSCSYLGAPNCVASQFDRRAAFFNRLAH